MSRRPSEFEDVPVGRPQRAGHRRSEAQDFTSFIGRGTELQALQGFVDGSIPLVSLIGPPGIGKTRLVRRFLERRCVDTTPAIFCDLRGVATADGLVARLAETLNGHLETGGDSTIQVDAVGAQLASRGHCLIVLDNFEQLIPGAVDTVQRWLRTASEACFIITSRRMLRLRSEIVCEVSPLGLDAPQEGGESEAVQLFLDRAKSSEPSFDGTAVTDVNAIVRRLEGIPLAIELAAGQMRKLHPQELLRELEKASSLALESDDRDVEPRHASLRAAIEGSWNLLDPIEQATLSQLATFRQGFTFEAAAAIVDLPKTTDAPSLRAVIASLREASLLRLNASVADSTRLRWDVYESIREFAGAVPDREARTRHAAYYVEAGKKWTRNLGTPEEPAARSALQEDLENLRTAFEWLARENANPDVVAVAELALVIYEVHCLSRPTLALHPLSVAIDFIGDETSSLRTRLLTARGVCFRSVGEPDRALSDFENARRGAVDPLLVASLDLEEAIHLCWSADVRQARALLSETVAAAERHRSLNLESRGRTYLGIVLDLGFQDPKCHAEYDKALRLALTTGNVHGQMLTRTVAALAQIRQRRGLPLSELQALAAAARDRGNRVVEAIAEQTLGVLYLDADERGASRFHLHRALSVCHENGLRRYQGYTEAWLGMLDEADGSCPGVDSRHQDTAVLLHSIGDVRSEAFALLALSVQAAREEGVEEAHAVLKQAESLWTGLGDASLPLLAELQQARIELVASRQAADAGDASTSRRRYERAQALVKKARLRFPPDASDRAVKPSLIDRCVEARWALRCYEREHGIFEHDRAALRIESDGRGFWLGDGTFAELPQGLVIRRALVLLAERRIETPGEPIPFQTFVGRCWPGEKISAKAQSQRMRQVVARLRKAGLAGTLRHTKAGYLLDPDTAVMLVGPQADEPDRCSESA